MFQYGSHESDKQKIIHESVDFCNVQKDVLCSSQQAQLKKNFEEKINFWDQIEYKNFIDGVWLKYRSS